MARANRQAASTSHIGLTGSQFTYFVAGPLRGPGWISRLVVQTSATSSGLIDLAFAVCPGRQAAGAQFRRGVSLLGPGNTFQWQGHPVMTVGAAQNVATNIELLLWRRYDSGPVFVIGTVRAQVSTRIPFVTMWVLAELDVRDPVPVKEVGEEVDDGDS